MKSNKPSEIIKNFVRGEKSDYDAKEWDNIITKQAQLVADLASKMLVKKKYLISTFKNLTTLYLLFLIKTEKIPNIEKAKTVDFDVVNKFIKEMENDSNDHTFSSKKIDKIDKISIAFTDPDVAEIWNKVEKMANEKANKIYMSIKK